MTNPEVQHGTQPAVNPEVVTSGPLGETVVNVGGVQTPASPAPEDAPEPEAPAEPEVDDAPAEDAPVEDAPEADDAPETDQAE